MTYIKKTMPKVKCKNCNTHFIPKSTLNIYCSAGCYDYSQERDLSAFKHLHKGTVGAISEILVSVDLMKKGWDVFRSLSPASNCDMLAIKNDVILKLEVRTGNYYKLKTTGEKKLSYPKERTEGKVIAAVTYSDNKINYIGIDI